MDVDDAFYSFFQEIKKEEFSKDPGRGKIRVLLFTRSKCQINIVRFVFGLFSLEQQEN